MRTLLRAKLLGSRPLGKSPRDAEAGQAIIEMLIALPLLLVLVFGIVEFAAAWRTFHVVTNSTREGARRAVVLGTTAGQESEVFDAVRARLAAGGLDPDVATITVACEWFDGTRDDDVICSGDGSIGSGDVVNVVYPYTFMVLGPVVGLICDGCGDRYGTVNLTAQTIMRHE